jgi:hypothetical protein
VADRREFIGSIAGSVLAAPFAAIAQAAIAQPAARPPRIGILGNFEGAPWDGFRAGLRELGYVEGRAVLVDWRWAEGRVDRYPALANELVQAKVDLIVTSGTPAALAAKQATGSIPIVMTIAAYPERMGLAESLSHPGGNITGFSHAAPDVAGKPSGSGRWRHIGSSPPCFRQSPNRSSCAAARSTNTSVTRSSSPGSRPTASEAVAVENKRWQQENQVVLGNAEIVGRRELLDVHDLAVHQPAIRRDLVHG